MATLDQIKEGYINNLGKPQRKSTGHWSVVDLGEYVATDINGHDVWLSYPNAHIVERFDDSDEGNWAAQDYIDEHKKPVIVSASRRYWSLICFFEEA